MKNIVLIFTQFMMAAITLVIVMSIYARLNRSMELQRNLSSIVETSVENVMQEYLVSECGVAEYTQPWLAEEVFMKELADTILMSIETESDITIDVYQCDLEKGILALQVTADFIYPNGKTGSVSCEKCVILVP